MHFFSLFVSNVQQLGQTMYLTWNIDRSLCSDHAYTHTKALFDVLACFDDLNSHLGLGGTHHLVIGAKKSGTGSTRNGRAGAKSN